MKSPSVRKSARNASSKCVCVLRELTPPLSRDRRRAHRRHRHHCHRRQRQRSRRGTATDPRWHGCRPGAGAAPSREGCARGRSSWRGRPWPRRSTDSRRRRRRRLNVKVVSVESQKSRSCTALVPEASTHPPTLSSPPPPPPEPLRPVHFTPWPAGVASWCAAMVSMACEARAVAWAWALSNASLAASLSSLAESSPSLRK